MRMVTGATNGAILSLCFGAGIGCGALVVVAFIEHRLVLAVLLCGYAAMWWAVYEQRRMIMRLRATVVKATERAYQNGLAERKLS